MNTTDRLQIGRCIHSIHFSILNYKKMDFLELNNGLSRYNDMVPVHILPVHNQPPHSITLLYMHIQVDIFTANLIMIPVHLGSHWALAVVDNQKCEVEYYDSLQYNGSPCLDRIV